MSTGDHTTRVEYREIPECIGYRFGSDGSVWTRWRIGQHTAILGDQWRSMRPRRPSKRGYLRAWTKVNGDPKLLSVHTMVATAFYGPRPDGMECRHLNGDPLDNRIENLAWGTPQENASDRVAHGTTLIGERNHSTKLTPDDVREIRRRHAEGEGVTAIARSFGVYHHNVTCIVKRKTWKHVD